MPRSFILSKQNGVAQVKFEVSDLVDSKGQQVESAAIWSKMDLRVVKKDGRWLKVVIDQGIEGMWENIDIFLNINDLVNILGLQEWN